MSVIKTILSEEVCSCGEIINEGDVMCDDCADNWEKEHERSRDGLQSKMSNL